MSLRECHTCQGTGQLQCNNCNGDGRIVCFKCEGTGHVVYFGHGASMPGGGLPSSPRMFPKSDFGYSGGNLRSFRGFGSSGTGSCNKCDETGYLTCRKCEGTGNVRCLKCKGSGNVDTEELRMRRQSQENTQLRAAGLSDIVITCRDCGNSFVFSPSEQEFFRSKGFSNPTRCPNCRQARKKSR